jgi:type III secretion protein L
MTGLIKAASAGALVRSLGAGSPRRAAGEGPVEPSRSRTELALDEAHDEISRLQTALIEARALAESAPKEAREAGRKEGHREVEDDMARRLALIGKGIERAEVAWHERLGALDALAAMLARSGLAKVVGDGADLADLVTRAIALRVRAMRHESIVGIRVSAADFPDADALDALRAGAGSRSIEVIADAALDAGECRFDLQLGHIDLGIRPQWRELDRFFEALAADPAE